MLKLQPAVKQETARIALGTACLACIMLLVFLLLDKLDLTVVLGTLLGYVAAVGNFFLMALTIQNVVENMHAAPAAPVAPVAPVAPATSAASAASAAPEKPEPASGEAEDEEAPAPSALTPADRKRIQLSYTGRMLLMAAVGVIALTVDLFHPIAALLCLLFPRIVIFLLGILDKKKEKEA